MALSGLQLSSSFLLPSPALSQCHSPFSTRGLYAASENEDGSNSETTSTTDFTETSTEIEANISPPTPQVTSVNSVSTPSSSGKTIEQLVAELEVDKSGVSAPFGFFDPLGFYKDATLKQKKKLREAELKHGRIAMLATLGIVVVEKLNFHPFYGYDNYDMGPACNHWQLIGSEVPDFWLFLGFVVSSMEMKNIIKGWDPLSESVFAEGGPKLAGLRTDVISGDLDFDPLGLCPEESDIFLDLRTRELNNGRLAMIAAIGMLVQEKFVTGQPIFN
jgi:light-harvesting complex I chlorophyll a/b binding protein 1